MADDYGSIISSLETTRDTVAADLAATAAELAALPAVAPFNEGGDGGTESIDVVGLRRQLMSEMTDKQKLIDQLTMSIAKYQAGFSMRRIPSCGGLRMWSR